MDSLEISYDHYKETCELSRQAQSRRNKNFVILCVLEATSFLFLVEPEKTYELIQEGIHQKLNMTVQLSNTLIQTLLWLIITYVMIRYIQDMLYIERQYKYMEKLEKHIANELGVFEREGKNYQKNYPMVLNFIDLFYKMLMPIFFLAINIVKIYTEWKISKNKSIALVSYSILFVATFIIVWFYFFEIHSKITKFCKKHIPLVERATNILRKILEEV